MIKKLSNHFLKHRGIYFYAPVTLILLFGALNLYKFLTGKSSIEDINSLIAVTLNLIFLVLIQIFAKFTNEHLFCCLSNEEFKSAGFWTKTLDTFQTIFCLCFCAYLVLH